MMKTKKWKAAATIGCVAAAFTIGVVAAPVVQDITAQLRPDMTIVIDGQAWTFQDVNGTQVYPIMYIGTTHLPIRAIGGIMQKAVDWDDATQTVTLGEKDYYVDLLGVTDEGDGYAGAKVVSSIELTFPYGDLQELKTFDNAIRLVEVNSADKTFQLELTGTYSFPSTTLYNPPDSDTPVTMEVRDADSGIVLLSKSLDAGTSFEAANVDLHGATNLEFSAKGATGHNDTVYFLNPAVKQVHLYQNGRSF